MNMTKSQFIKKLVNELERLETVERLSQLAQHYCYEEVDEVVKDINYSIVDQYTESDRFKKLNVSDIPKQYILTFAIYLYGCRKHDENELMGNWGIELQRLLYDYGDVGKAIANSMAECDISAYESFENLIAGIYEGN